MGFLITPPPVSVFDGNVTQLKLDSTVSSTSTLIANTASTLIPLDGTATNGRKIYSIVNTSTSAIVKIALGRTATATDYDYVLYPENIIGDFDFSKELISVISTGTPTVNASYAKYVEV
ncbi:hypothetical protein PL11201_490081 [Planktothrix sp. PCC 11201]|uniref:hypothetical protein n=1 Tax=Planktothrix sp. PCC 11201 TaxID=1729650 RepID=UPI000920120A|nr:hypothetical protein [Planktothrix sp. PCC 11201]SKB11187.1 hypothetical protein PL11201_110005 [Planktothrix sp. PCC 11201]SKB13346.1 hypothetical protein PL11201_490081 [Planktothrix sp. PCC 11201]